MKKYKYFRIQYKRNSTDTWHNPQLRRYSIPKQNRFTGKLKANIWFLRQ